MKNMEIIMKLASLKSDDRDGALMIVSRDLTSMCDASSVSSNLRHAIEHWTDTFPLLTKLARFGGRHPPNRAIRSNAIIKPTSQIISMGRR